MTSVKLMNYSSSTADWNILYKFTKNIRESPISRKITSSLSFSNLISYFHVVEQTLQTRWFRKTPQTKNPVQHQTQKILIRRRKGQASIFILLYRPIETTSHITPELDKYSILDVEIYRIPNFWKSLINYRHNYFNRCSFSRSMCRWGSNPNASPLASPARMAADKTANR